MEKPPMYSISPASATSGKEKEFLILTDFQEPMQNHLGRAYLPLSQKVAEGLVKDINEILPLKFQLDEKKPKIKLSYEEVLNHPRFREIRKAQEKISFAVCVHNTLLEVKDDTGFRLEVHPVIQWDFLYRMSPGPREKMEQMQAAAEAIQWLGKDWVDLPANYASSVEEMEADEVPFVPQVILDRLHRALVTMTLEELVAVWVLYDSFNRFSITLPILWVKGFISGATLEDSYYVMASGFSPKEIRKFRKEEGDFLRRRLGFLREYLEANKTNNTKK
jgi:hypothetical protein